MKLKIFLVSTILIVNLVGVPSYAKAGPEEPSVLLGFSGATLSIKSIFDPTHPGTAHRSLELKGANGARRSIGLHDGGGQAHSNALNLYHLDRQRFLVVSERDCVEIDAAHVITQQCVPREPCDQSAMPSATYLGRFDWMNGFDPPHGEFGARFRFLPAYDATCSK
jgi:hypothetical protein